MFPGVGTLVNMLAILVGTALGVLVGHRFHQRTRDVVTDGLGLVTLLIAGTAAMAVAPKRDQTIPTHLSEPEIARLIETPSSGDPLGRRDRAIFELFYASGLRLSELVSIDLEDLNLGDRMVRVMGKGGKERLLPFNQSTLSALRAWMQDRATILAARKLKADSRKPKADGRQGNSEA